MLSAAYGDTVQLSPNADSTITVHPGLGGPTGNLGSDPNLFSIGSPGTWQSAPILSFDLSSLQPSNVNGNGTVNLIAQGTYADGTYNQTIDMYQVLVPWTESGVTWNNFGPGPIPGTNIGSTPLANFSGSISVGDTVSFTVPQDVLQAWIDNPSQNYGLLFVPTQGASNDVYFGSKEGDSASAPTLTMDVTPTPEPSTWALVGAGLLSVSRFRLSRRSK